MRCDQLRQRIGPFSARAHVVVIESLDLTDLGQTLLPSLHTRMRRRRTRTRGKNNQTAAHGVSSAKTQSNTAVASISIRNSGAARDASFAHFEIGHLEDTEAQNGHLQFVVQCRCLHSSSSRIANAPRPYGCGREVSARALG